jgi:hypothetical protein
VPHQRITVVWKPFFRLHMCHAKKADVMEHPANKRYVESALFMRRVLPDPFRIIAGNVFNLRHAREYTSRSEMPLGINRKDIHEMKFYLAPGESA